MSFLTDPFERPPGSCWAPSVDVYRTGDGWVLKFDLAGVRPDDISIEAGKASIRVTGVRRDRFVQQGWSHHSIEISYSRFERVVKLPCEPRRAAVSSEYVDGMLLVRVDTTEMKP